MRRLLPSLIIGMVGLLSCNSRQTYKEVKTIKVRPAVKILVNSIAKYNVVNSQSIGYGGLSNVQWKRFDSLSKVATVEELRSLTNHSNTAVRSYAFEALVGKKDSAVYTILIRHIRDTARVKTLFGCIMGEKPVGDFFLQLTYPDEGITKEYYQLTSEQKKVVDSLLFYGNNIRLVAKNELIRRLKPLPKYYSRLRSIALVERNPEAIWKLAYYKKQQDVPIIKTLFNNAKDEYFALNAVSLFPESSFYPKLIAVAEADIKDAEHIDSEWSGLCDNLAQFPTTQTADIFYRVLENRDNYIRKQLAIGINAAINKHPHAVFSTLEYKLKASINVQD